MMKRILAFDGGGTRTRAGLYDYDGLLLAEAEGGPSNPVDLGMSGCLASLEELARYLAEDADGEVDMMVAALSGAGAQKLREELGPLLAHEFNVRTAIVTSDTVSVAEANFHGHEGILAIAGTGSAVMVRNASGALTQLGNRGPLVGDGGGAYRIAERALREAARAYDGVTEPTLLLNALATAAHVSDFDDLKLWARDVTKAQVAALALAVTNAAADGDATAIACVRAEADALAELVAVARARHELQPDSPIYVTGGVYANCALYRDAFAEGLAARGVTTTPQTPPTDGHAAAVRLAFADRLPRDAEAYESTGESPLAPTEHRLIAEKQIDELTALQIVELMNREDGRTVDAVARVKRSIAKAIERIAHAFAEGGRLIYVGAGTSGRLGVLDASECPPTFGVGPEQVVGIIAGGEDALRSSVEGAEDDEERGAIDLRAYAPSALDVVCGIATSGTTPYVLSALAEAKRVGAGTVMVCCNPKVRDVADVVIRLDTGAEVLAGSTRLKAGTATKMVLNQITTGAMTLSGFVFEGLMVRVKPVNAKLRRRAIRIVGALTTRSDEDAAVLLRDAGDRIPVAVLMGRLGIDAGEAEKRLADAGGELRAALHLE